MAGPELKLTYESPEQRVQAVKTAKFLRDAAMHQENVKNHNGAKVILYTSKEILSAVFSDVISQYIEETREKP